MGDFPELRVSHFSGPSHKGDSGLLRAQNFKDTPHIALLSRSVSKQSHIVGPPKISSF